MKESFLKVGGLFLPITAPVLVIFTGCLTCTFRRVWLTSALKCFYRRSYIFGIITHLLMGKWFPWLAVKHSSKYDPEGWMVQSIEDFSLQNISNRINRRKSQIPILYIKFSVFFRWRTIYENAYKGLRRGTENYWSSL